jgi:hypothetical protein
VKHVRHYSEQKLQSVGIYKSAASAGIDSPKYDNHGALKTAAKLGLMSNDILNFTSGLSPVNLNQF